MNIISWNVNGLRALERSGDWGWLVKNSPDIFCLQEIKAEKDQLSQEISAPKGYASLFNSSRAKKGYSGVATYSKIEPKDSNFNLGDEELDKEGRLIETDYGDFVLFNIYFPNSGVDLKRLDYRLEFNDALFSHVENLRMKGKSIILCGDFNVAHEEIDIAQAAENDGKSGFHPDERAWFDNLMDAGYIDVFRSLNPSKKDSYTFWDTYTHARERNVGRRIDYFVVSGELSSKIKSIKHHTNVLGSDHCPVELVLK